MKTKTSILCLMIAGVAVMVGCGKPPALEENKKTNVVDSSMPLKGIRMKFVQTTLDGCDTAHHGYRYLFSSF